MSRPSWFDQDDVKAKIAMARFEHLKTGAKPETKQQLINRFDPRPPKERNPPIATKTLDKAITDAFRLGLVELVQTHIPGETIRDSKLEAQLVSAFPALNMAIVTNTEKLESSDLIHAQLGHALAEVISSARMSFRSNDLVSVGSGRGVFYAIKSLTKMKKVKLEEITIMSLTGSLFPHPTTDHLALLLDADTNTRLFAEYFTDLVHIRPVYYPIAYETKEDRDNNRAKTWLSEEDFINHKSDHTIVGVGVLNESHRMYREGKEYSGSKVMEPIRELLKNLTEFVDQIMNEDENYCPIVDVCNRMYFVDPPKGTNVNISKEIRNRIVELMKQTNDRLLTVTKTQLGQMDNVMLVAGTLIKAPAIFGLLAEQTPVRVHVLSTDSAAAKKILELNEKKD